MILFEMVGFCVNFFDTCQAANTSCTLKKSKLRIHLQKSQYYLYEGTNLTKDSRKIDVFKIESKDLKNLKVFCMKLFFELLQSLKILWFDIKVFDL